MKTRVGITGLLLCVIASYGAHAQQYPTKPIRLIVPYPSGAGSTDIMGRAIASRLSAQFGQSVVVDNRSGGGGTVGSRMVAKAAPDGYTLLIGVNGPLTIAPHIYDDMGFDPLRDLTPITMINISPFVLVAHPSIAANNIKEFIAIAKAKPLRYASTGIGGTPHLASELFNHMAGVSISHVPYKGGPPAITAVLTAEAHIYFTGVAAARPFVTSGRLRALGMARKQRSEALPDVAPIAEQGLPDFDVSGWQGLMGPAGMPAPIVQRLYDETARILNSADFKGFITKTGVESIHMNPKEFAAYLKTDTERWGRAVKAAGGIKAQ